MKNFKMEELVTIGAGGPMYRVVGECLDHVWLVADDLTVPSYAMQGASAFKTVLTREVIRVSHEHAMTKEGDVRVGLHGPSVTPERDWLQLRSSRPVPSHVMKLVREAAAGNGRRAELVYNTRSGRWDLVMREVERG